MLAALLTNLPVAEIEAGRGKVAGHKRWLVSGWTAEWIDPAAKSPKRPKPAPEPGIARTLDTLKAESAALSAEAALTKAEARWVTGRLVMLTKAVAAAEAISAQRRVQARLAAYRDRLMALQAKALERERQRLARIRRDDEDFSAILKLVE